MKTRSSNSLQEYSVNVKLKLAALWTAATFCYLYGDYFELYTPDKVSGLISGDNVLDSPISLLIASMVMVIPPAMIVLSLVLKPGLNKWLNVVCGTLFTLMMVVIGVGSLTPWYSFYVFLAGVEALLTFTVVVVALKWPRD